MRINNISIILHNHKNLQMMKNTVQHKIKAYLHDNPLTTENTNDMIARVMSERSLNIKDICESATNRGGANIPATAMQYATELFLKEMTHLLCDGYSVNTSYFTASILIKGNFESPSESFNPQKHNLIFRFNQGEKLRSELSNVEVEILGTTPFGTRITEIHDTKSGSINNLLTPNRNLKITGTKIKIAGDSDLTGIFFINIKDNNRTKVDPADIVTNYPSQLMLIIPELAPGEYIMEIATQFSPGIKNLKHPRTITFDKILTVK